MKKKENEIINYKKFKKKNAAKKSAKKKISFLRFLLSIAAVVIIVGGVLFANKSVATADESGNGVVLNKYYKTITIAPGDTLWSIANEYKSSAYRTTADYVNELKSMNGLGSDDITSGQKLVVAYFAQ